jgi:hypothetical protein
MLLSAVEELEKRLLTLDDISYDSIDRLMRSIMKKQDVTAKELHHGFVDKNKCTPDNWIRKQMKKKQIKESQYIDGSLTPSQMVKKLADKKKPPTAKSPELPSFLKKKEESFSIVNKILTEIEEESECGMKKVPSVESIAKKHKVDLKSVKEQLQKGIKVEHEHTNNEKLARTIALQHLAERPDYYTKLKKVEEETKHLKATNKKGKKVGADGKGCWDKYKYAGTDENGKDKCVPIKEATKLPSDYGNVLSVILTWRGRTIMSQMFFPQIKVPSRKQVEYEATKVYPDARLVSYKISEYNASQPIIQISNSRSRNYLLNNKTIGEEASLGKPHRTPGGPKKFAVNVKNEKGNVVTVRFGDPNMEIKRDDPDRLKAFRSRHNCDNPGPRTKARYWSCRQWRSGHKVED